MALGFPLTLRQEVKDTDGKFEHFPTWAAHAGLDEDELPGRQWENETPSDCKSFISHDPSLPPSTPTPTRV